MLNIRLQCYHFTIAGKLLKKIIDEGKMRKDEKFTFEETESIMKYMKTKLTTIEKLLKSVSPDIERKKEELTILKQSGEFFNILSVIGLKSEEVRLHSAFIAELLNPAGSHGQKEIFLKMFFDTLDDELKMFSPSKDTRIFVEFPIGKKTSDEGGRIDILIHDNQQKYIIAIENKIYACDQDNQLFRYKNYLKKQNGYTTKLLYLTLDGHKPTRKSTKKANPGKETYWKEISYKKTILNWLEKCLESVKDKNRLSIAIKQYIEIIEQILDYKERTMDNSIIEKIQKSILEASAISKNLEEAKRQIIQDRLMPEILDRMEKKNKWVFHKNSEFYKKGKPGTYFFITKSGWEKYGICFDIYDDGDEDNVKDYYGVATLNNSAALISDKKKCPIHKDGTWKTTGKEWLCWAELKDNDGKSLWLSPDWLNKINLSDAGAKEFVDIIEERAKFLMKQFENTKIKM